MSAASKEQALEISDGEATPEEYTAAFQRYRACLSSAGVELEHVAFSGRVYEFIVPNAAVAGGVDEDCYLSEFFYTDMLWQGTDDVQNSSSHAQFVGRCLEERGIEPKETLRGMDGQMSAAGIEVTDCLT